ncbi:MBOAT family O-acyltransferase [Flagellimonas hymeniacidonis]|uniref:MBOAT family O-acyltransferase n=1 Tax=Flagellimonas hymeniacidonis TaxID=2603628 RepID=UPI002938E0C5|nr:MBOAT family O-acyltransferase [Flagellimonas hymeniacidonis]
MGISIGFNIGILVFFKYFNFFVDSFVASFAFFGFQLESSWMLKVILPVGISFYTFQTLSYSLDIYRRNLEPTNSLISFATFVAFFPQLVAGPIERASRLLPQIVNPRKFLYKQQIEGLRLMLWGLFKKVAIADALAPIVDDIFLNHASYPSSTLVLGALFFGFQIYGDFSGYSDIAIGTAKLFGIELMSNFKFPYFSRNIAEFWRRWHISLSTWFRDYLYIPLGGSKIRRIFVVRNIFVIFLVSGLWHGANWTYVVWGLFHAILFLPLFYLKSNRRYLGTSNVLKSFSNLLSEAPRMICTFSLVTLGWIFFRSETLSDAFCYFERLLLHFSWDSYLHPRGYRMIDYYILLTCFVLFEYGIRKDERNPLGFKYRFLRLVCYLCLLLLIILFYDDGVDRSFIYFQF